MEIAKEEKKISGLVNYVNYRVYFVHNVNQENTWKI